MFLKSEDTWTANKYMKKRLTLLVNKEMQIKVTMVYHYNTPTKMANMQRNDKTKGWQGRGVTGTFSPSKNHQKIRWFSQYWLEFKMV